MLKNIPLTLAAAMMGKGYQFVRIGLQRNLLPIGNAVPTSGSDRRPGYTYYISPGKFMAYTGFTEEDIRQFAQEKGIKVV